MKTLGFLLMLHVLPVPTNDSHAAQEYCEAYGGSWNLYSNAQQTASWWECDVPGQSDVDEPNTDDCDENPYLYADDPTDACFVGTRAELDAEAAAE